MNQRKKLACLALAGVIALSLSACGSDQKQSADNGDGDAQKKKEKITFVLDWTPNTNHTGLYVADKLGYFDKAGIDVEIVQPPDDGASALVAAGKAEFGVDFQDSLAPAFAREDPLPITAVAAILQHNTSGIISKKGSGIDHPKGMEGKTYATWDMPIEKAMVDYVVRKDGGDPSKINMVPTTVTDVVTALESNIDAVWIYYAWDGIATEVKGLATDYFAFKDIDPVFDYYTPVIVANNDYLKKHPETAKKFLEALKNGYEYAIENPEEAANILLQEAPELDKDIVMASQKWIADQYKAGVPQWGYIDPARWDGFYKWLYDNKLVDIEIPAGAGFTNDYLPN